MEGEGKNGSFARCFINRRYTWMNMDKIKMQIFHRHHCDRTAMMSAPIPPRRDAISVPRYQGTGNWTDVPIYPTSGQKQIYPFLSASICGENCS